MSNNFTKRLCNILLQGKNEKTEKSLLKRIENGFKSREFKMHLQFLVDNTTKEITSAEALSRWESEDGKIIPPMEYIGVMEKHGLIERLDFYMLEEACKKLCEWKDGDLSELSISCNFTRLTISESGFVEKVRAIADKYDFDRKRLVIEITEDSVETNPKLALSNVIKVKELGFRIALDDVGTGYTTLISLCEYPTDIVKIDRDILLLSDTEKGKKLFCGIVSLAHGLGLKVVCEGVETEEQNDFAKDSGCDYIQGWYYSKALPEKEAEVFAREYGKSL